MTNSSADDLLSDVRKNYSALVEDDPIALIGIPGNGAFDDRSDLHDPSVLLFGHESGSTSLASSTTISSPDLLQSFAGPNFDSVAQVSGFYMIPADCTEATGRLALIAATNG